MVFRENTEGLYTGIGGQSGEDTGRGGDRSRDEYA